MAEPYEITFKGRYRDFTLRGQDVLNLSFYWAIWLILLLSTPNNLHDARTRIGVIVIGFFGLWRYSWWLLNFLRSQYYGRVVYPMLRAHADEAWERSKAPRRVHFLMTTFHEHPWTTYRCLDSILSEVRSAGLQATLWVGTGADADERVIGEWREQAPEADLDIVLVRQNRPGKRAAIACILRSLSRHGVEDGDIAVLMDGDSIIIDGCMRKCLSLFEAFPSLQALTTDEDAVCVGPLWTQKWLTMRFAQRRMWMQSHALSRRVLTLTGRFSCLRAASVIQDEFIRLVEGDHLNHWFWGSFRFLSGDDKSTWYCMLKQKADMLYVPDAMVTTVERVDGTGFLRAKDNLLRWSGNMLRNGMRAIALGPKVVPPFIWWCLIDQRLTIWTTLTGFFTAMSTIFFVKPSFVFTYILWIMLTRFLMASAMFFYSARIHVSYPLILYCNQLTLAFIKVYLLFRLPQQRWANRMDQRGDDLRNSRRNRIFPLWQNVFYVTLLALALLLCIGVLRWPDFQQIFPLNI